MTIKDQHEENRERAVMVLAVLSVLLYLTDLRGIWAGERQSMYQILVVVIDVIFLLDLGTKLVSQKNRYLFSPWFVIDFLSTLPVLGSIFHVLGFEPFLRAIRSFRFLRTLRGIRSIRLLKEFRLIQDHKETPEQVRYHRVLSVSVIAFAFFFIFILRWVQQTSSPEAMNEYEFFLVLGSLLGIALMLLIVRYLLPALAMGQIRQLLNVALPKQVAEHFIQDPSLYHKTVRMPATIVFCDIQGFTTSVEKLGDDLDQLKEQLEEAMQAIVSCHVEYDLIVDKFIGDAVMSFRGGNLVQGTPQEHAYRVVRATLESIASIKALKNPYFHNVRIGGASSKKALIGTFGTVDRLSYTILGDRVNLAARLESMCKQSGTSNLFCHDTFALTKDASDIVWRRFGTVDIRGKTEPITVYEAFDARKGENFSWIAHFEQGVDAFEEEEYEQAKKFFVQCHNGRVDGDQSAEIYLQRIEQMSS